MERAIFQTVQDPNERLQNLKDTADGIELVEYMKPFEANEMVQKKEELANVSIKLDDISKEKKKVNEDFATQEKEPKETKKLLLKELKEKANQVKEQCFIFYDDNTLMAGFYNAVGVLVYSRPMTPKEIEAQKQQSIPAVIREMGGNQ